MKTKRRLLSLLLCGAMLFLLCPQSVLAEGGTQDSGQIIAADGLCEHHLEHDADCGYLEGGEGTPCSHEHRADCYIEVTECVHEHSEDCYPEEAGDSVSGNDATPSDAEEREPENCPHICDEDSGCITKELNCQHEHDDECGYVPATEGTPCKYVCGICTGETGEQTETDCICSALCTTEAVNEDCPVCGAEDTDLALCEGEESATPSNAEAVTVATVQAMIDDLPNADEITEGNAEEVKEQLEAIDEAKAQLSDEETDELDFSRYIEAAAALEQLLYKAATPSDAVMLLSDEAQEDRSTGWIVDDPEDLPQEMTTFTAGGGTMVWEPVMEDGRVVSGTLILTNAAITGEAQGIRLPVPVTVALEGSNSIEATQDSGTGTKGIWLYDNSSEAYSKYGYYPEQALTIQGSGSLSVTSAGGGLEGSSVTIEKGAEVSIQCPLAYSGINTGNGDIIIRDNSTVRVKVTGGSGTSAGGICANDTVNDDIAGGNVIIEDSHVVAICDSGTAIAAKTSDGGNITFTDSDVVAIGSNSNTFGVVTGGGSKTISGGSLYAKNNSDGDYDLPPYVFTAGNSAVIYYGDQYYMLISGGDNVQYANCTYDEDTDTVTAVGNGYMLGDVEWNENIRFSQGTTLYLQNHIRAVWEKGNLTIPEGVTAVIPAGGTIKNAYGSSIGGQLINNGTLCVEGTADNYTAVTNNGTLNITGAFYNNIDSGFSGSIEGTGPINGITIEYYSEFERTYQAHGNAVMGYDMELGKRIFQASEGDFKAEIPMGTTLTIPEGRTLDASGNRITADNLAEYFSLEGNIVVEGTLLLPSDVPEEALEGLSGEGTVKAGNDVIPRVTFMSEGKIINTAFVLPNGIPTPPEPTRTGYILSGWSPEPEPVVEDMTYTAEWKLEAPGISPDGGSISGETTVSITSKAAGAVIYYTLDGTEPTSSGIVYTGPFVLSDSAIVKAIATQDGALDSDITEAEFAMEVYSEETRIVRNDLTEVPEELKDTNFNTVDKIKNELIRILTVSSGYTEVNTAVYDVKLQISTDGGKTWIDATEDKFPASGITVVIPYPSGTGKTTHDFTVTHMFTVTSSVLGTTAGGTEQPTVTKTDEGIRVTLKGLSPVGIAWKTISGGNSSGGDGGLTTDCTLNFETNGGSSIEKVTGTYDKTIDLSGYVPTRDGYDFSGWYSDKELTNRITEIRLTGNKTVYAGWTERKENPGIGADTPADTPFTDVKEADGLYDDVVYKLVPDASDSGSSGTGGGTSGWVQQTGSPQTGDGSHMGLWLFILCISAGALAALLIFKRRKDKENRRRSA